jgi:hypothetical protein
MGEDPQKRTLQPACVNLRGVQICAQLVGQKCVNFLF